MEEATHADGRPAVFVDRDGVINRLVPEPATGLSESPLSAAEATLIPGAAAALRRVSQAGLLLVGVSNQPAAAKGSVSWDQLMAVHNRVMGLLESELVRFDAFLICPHHPGGVVAELSRTCDCRKPAPGLLLAAARKLTIDLSASWMVGDTDADVSAGTAAGCRTVLIENPESAHKRAGEVTPDFTTAGLTEAITEILRPGHHGAGPRTSPRRLPA